MLVSISRTHWVQDDLSLHICHKFHKYVRRYDRSMSVRIFLLSGPPSRKQESFLASGKHCPAFLESVKQLCTWCICTSSCKPARCITHLLHHFLHPHPFPIFLSFHQLSCWIVVFLLKTFWQSILRSENMSCLNPPLSQDGGPPRAEDWKSRRDQLWIMTAWHSSVYIHIYIYRER